MTLSDASTLHSLANWRDECLYVKEFVHKNTLPQIVRIIKGHYQGLGASSGLSTNSNSAFLLVSLGTHKGIHAQCVKFKDSRKVSAIGPKLAVPSTFKGYFEILSEDGRCVRSIESVEELCRKFPDSVLVRENIRAFVSKGDDPDKIRERSRIISVGETLLLIGEVSSHSSHSPSSMLSSSASSSSSGSSSSSHSSRYLRCFDERGDNIYLPLESRGKFSVIAKEDQISGVHSVSNILNKRLPLMARLASGTSPPVGLRNSQTFVPEMRLFSSVQEEMLVALTLNGKDSCQLIPLPVSVLLKIQAASNLDVLKQTIEFSRLLTKCKDLGESILEKIMVHDISLGRDLRLHGLDKHHPNQIKRITSPPPLSTSSANNLSGGNRNQDDYDEIEQIYDYVRGFAPIPKGTKSWAYDEAPEPPPLETLPTRLKTNHHHHSSVDYIGNSQSPWIGSSQYLNDVKKIPENTNINIKNGKSEVKKRPSTKESKVPKSNENKNPQMEAGLRTRYVKSANYRQVGQKHKFFRGGSSKKESSSSSIFQQTHHHPNPTRPSPLFNLRYKSLTNLAGGAPGVVTYTPDYDTLNSSNSGGKASGGGDSGGSRNLPEKRSRKLCRPKSLTNLVWGPSSGHPPSNVKISEKSSSKKVDPHHHPAMYTHRRLSKELSSSSAIHGRKLGSSGNLGKRIGTLYL